MSCHVVVFTLHWITTSSVGFVPVTAVMLTANAALCTFVIATPADVAVFVSAAEAMSVTDAADRDAEVTVLTVVTVASVCDPASAVIHGWKSEIVSRENAWIVPPANTVEIRQRM